MIQNINYSVEQFRTKTHLFARINHLYCLVKAKPTFHGYENKNDFLIKNVIDIVTVESNLKIFQIIRYARLNVAIKCVEVFKQQYFCFS